MTTWALLSQYAQVVEVRGKTLTLSFSTEPIRRQFVTGGNDAVLAEVLRETLGVDWRGESLVAAGGHDAAGATERAEAADRTSSTTRGGGVAASTSYDSFAPGDDPLDEPADDAAAALPPEDAAIARLQEALGAKVIGEIDPG
jgi:DNA polymerase-3 subunit gamma/tau